jgi:hypothetical protein
MTDQEIHFESETRKHQQEVAKLLMRFSALLLHRAVHHDESKLKEPERSVFAKFSPLLRSVEYGSDEYKSIVSMIRPAVDHHNAHNKHHPEYNDINGLSTQTLNDPIRSMDLIDIVEMLCDWIASVKRNPGGSIGKSIDIGEKRFKMDGQLSQLLRNTSHVIEPEVEKIPA